MGIGGKLAMVALALGMVAGIGACEKNRDEMRPDMDTVMSHEQGLQSRDLREMTDRMAPDLLQIPEITQNPTRITVVVKGVQNKTEDEAGKNMDIFVARLAGLLSDKARDRILFVADRQTLSRMQGEELGNPDAFEEGSRGGAAPDPTIHPQFFLYGTIMSMNSGRTTYYLCQFKLTNSTTGAEVWHGQYETRTLNLR